MENPEVTVADLRARAAFVDAELRKLVDKVDPKLKSKAEKQAEKVEQQEEELLEQEADAEKSQRTETVEDDYDEQGRKKFVPGKTQPRDAKGKFRIVLARLKQDLGTSGNQDVIEKIKEAENFDNVGNYAGAAAASSELIDKIDRLDTGALNAKSVENVREATADLGKVIANLPLPFENQAQKVRYSDLPPTLQRLTKSLIDRVEQKIGKEDADIATQEIRGFMSGSDVYSQAEISSQLNRLLRLLT
jgi:hypothetical protein